MIAKIGCVLRRAPRTARSTRSRRWPLQPGPGHSWLSKPWSSQRSLFGSSTFGLLVCGLVVCGETGCRDQTENRIAESPAAERETVSPPERAVTNPAVAAPNRRDAADRDSGPRSSTETTGRGRDANSAEPAETTGMGERQQVLDRFFALAQAGNYQPAGQILQRYLVQHPTDHEIVSHLGNLYAASGKLEQALELFESVPADHPELGLGALGVSADLCLRLGRFDEAIDRYHEVLTRVPDAVQALRPLAYLYNRQGRRHSAVPLVQRLCRLGDVTADELSSLIARSDAMYDDPSSRDADAPATPGTRTYLPIGAAGVARKQFTEHEYAAAAETLRPVVATKQTLGEVSALFGRSLIEAQNDTEYQDWLAKAEPSAMESPDYWAALANHLMTEARHEEAGPVLRRALSMDPTDLRTLRRLVQWIRLRDADDAEKADAERRATEHYQSVVKTIEASRKISESNDLNDPQRLAAMNALASELESMDRPLEAIIWKLMAAGSSSSSTSSMQALVARRDSLVQNDAAFTDVSALLDDWGLQEQDADPVRIAEAIRETAASRQSIAATSDVETLPADRLDSVTFENVAERVGLRHRYRPDAGGRQKGFAITQQLGGGVAVVDFDRDGLADVFLAQAASDGPEDAAEASDLLYRSVGQTSALAFGDVTDPAGVTDTALTGAVTVGDWNQDGFEDLVASDRGSIRLLINNGDGSFRSRSIDLPPRGKLPATMRLGGSVAMADFDADGFNDVWIAQYLHDAKGDEPAPLDELGRVTRIQAPLDFDPAHDLIYRGDDRGDGVIEPVSNESAQARTGMGVVAGPFNATFDGSLQVFVGNDVRPNQLWTYDGAAGFVEAASARGIAFGGLGSATASMGVAVADFDRSGTLDIHVTNFFGESSSHYLQTAGLFRDRSVASGVRESSMERLGFGCQAIDFTNDGWPDLVAANGHVEDLDNPKEPFRQLHDALLNTGKGFRSIPLRDPSGDLERPQLGRGLAVADFDRDGRQDFVVTDLLGPTMLAVNRQPNRNHFVEFELVGTRSARDAIGAVVEVRTPRRTFRGWRVSGDGYFARNEPVVHLGLARTEVIDDVRVRWPSGHSESFGRLTMDERHVVVEGTGTDVE